MWNKAAVLAPVGMALLAGAVIPFQAAANASVGRLMGHPLWAALISLCVSLLVIVPAMMMVRLPAPNLGSLLQGPWWLWIGGLCGAIYVLAAAALIPRLGGAGFLVCVVAGQMLVAVMLDHYGLLGLAGRAVTLPRLAGMALILAGVFLVQLPATVKAAAPAPYSGR